MLIPAGLLLMAFFYFAGLVGKSRAEEQMRELKSFVEQATGEAIFHDRELSSTITTG
jgi:Tfp pilus assembly protein FimT